MKKRTDKKRAEITTLPILPGTLVICGCILAVLLVLLLVFYYTGILSPPPFLSRILYGNAESGPESGFGEEFLASLNGKEPELYEEDVRLLDLSEPQLKELLLQSAPVDSWYQLADITWTDGAAAFTKWQVLCIASGERAHVEVFSGAHSLTKYIISDASSFYIRENESARLFSRTGEYASFTPQSEAGMPSYARMQQMIAEAEEGKYELSLQTVQSSPCIRASFTDALSGVREIFEVMPDCGLILNAYSYLPGEDTPYYQMQTSAVMIHLTGLDETLFDIPKP
ncbi:MAG: hypothetical protein ACI3XP_07040 [Eubacteriales bacterium]